VAVAVLAVAIVMGAAVAGVAGLAGDRAQARAAADLAALAGAYQVRRELASTVDDESTRAGPCAAARRTAAANGATVRQCHEYGDGSVQVTVASGRAEASARAGPEAKGPGGDSG